MVLENPSKNGHGSELKTFWSEICSYFEGFVKCWLSAE